MRVKVTIEGYYNVPDNLKEREEMYGETDPQKCIEVDQKNCDYGDEISSLALLLENTTAQWEFV